jgi:hypothetical protein
MHVIFLMFGVTALLLNPRLEISAIYLDPGVINIGLLGAQVSLLLLLLWISIGKSKQLIKQAAVEAELKTKAKGLAMGSITRNDIVVEFTMRVIARVRAKKDSQDLTDNPSFDEPAVFEVEDKRAEQET